MADQRFAEGKKTKLIALTFPFTGNTRPLKVCGSVLKSRCVFMGAKCWIETVLNLWQ
jgi:hypothetical protein